MTEERISELIMEKMLNQMILISYAIDEENPKSCFRAYTNAFARAGYYPDKDTEITQNGNSVYCHIKYKGQEFEGIAATSPKEVRFSYNIGATIAMNRAEKELYSYIIEALRIQKKELFHLLDCIKHGKDAKSRAAKLTCRAYNRVCKDILVFEQCRLNCIEMVNFCSDLLNKEAN